VEKLDHAGLVIGPRCDDIFAIVKKNIPAPPANFAVKLPYRVFVVDDHPIFSDVLAELLNQSGDFVVAGSASNGEEALTRLASMEVDVLLLDLMLPGISGLEVLERLRGMDFAAKTVVYSGVATDEAIAAAFAQGVSAFIEKSAGVDELLTSLRSVMKGEFPMNSRMSSVLRAVVRQRTARKDLAPSDLLILRRLALRHTAKEISDELGMSASAVYKARTRIGARLGLSGRAGFFSAAASLGLVQVMPELAAGIRVKPARP
jgi:two-component system nitrate/nitrite response regulator NarL